MASASENKILKQLSEMSGVSRNNLILKNEVSTITKQILDSVESDNVKLKVDKIWTKEKYSNDDIKAQMDTRNRHQSWIDEVRADVSLIDKTTGKTIDNVKGMKISSIPKMTPRATYLVKGNEYQFTKQSRLKPGVYTRIQNNGEISSFFNVDKTIDFDRGFNNNFKLNFNPDKKTFTMGYGSKNIPLYNVLKAVGVTDNEMKSSWGKEVFDSNSKAYAGKDEKNQRRMYEAIFNKKAPDSMSQTEVSKEIKDRLFATELDPETTKITLGKAFKKVDKGSLLSASNKIIGVHRGDVKPDDRDSLIFKSFHDIEDHIRENLIKNSDKIVNNLKFKLNKTRSINKSLSSQTFDPFVLGTLTTSQLSNPPSQTNMMSTLGEASKITVMGEGGIGSTNQISDEARQISNSEAGFIDPLHTPEGSAIGTTVHSTFGSMKIGKDIYNTFLTPAGKPVMLKPMDLHGKTIAFPDEDLSKPKVKAIVNGELKEVSSKKVDYQLGSASSMFDTSANMIPFLNSLQGNRGLTASKMQEQALTLKNRDMPLYKIVDKKIDIGKTFGSQIAVPKSPVNGKITAITKDDITIDNKHKVQLYNDFPLNSEGFLANNPIVEVGDNVKKDQILADNNNTRGGEFALGGNLSVAYLPLDGYNYEDSTIVSETAADKLTSLHLYGKTAKRSSKGVFSRDKFKAYYPEELTSVNSRKLDKDGVVKVGQTVGNGDVLIAHMEKRLPTADDIALGRLDKQLRKDFANNSVKWDKDHKGTVTSVEKHGNTVTVNVKTEEKLKVADKLSGIHGNKHIVSRIVKDDEMPKTPDGKTIHITMNPIGVSNRINTSQLLEAAAGRIAEKTGKRYTINNFSGKDNSRQIMKDLHDAGLSDKETLTLPDGTKTLNPVATGIANVMKLEHKIDHKYSARYREGYDSNEQAVSGGETGGKNLGRMEVGALLARGAKENLKEMFDIKGQRNDDYWKALEMGHALPPAKTPFVWDKMKGMMRGAGINVEQEGKTFSLKPMTDTDVKTLSAGELSRPIDTYRKKDLTPIKGGLFDPVKTGGLQGQNYTHFKLPEKVLNPMMGKATATILGISEKKLDEVLDGKQFVNRSTGELTAKGSVNATSGGPAIETMLSKVDTNKLIKDSTATALRTRNATEMNKMNRKIKYLKALKRNKMKPTDYMVENILVTPPNQRPMFSMGTEGTVIMSDVNDLYQQAATTAQTMKEYKKEVRGVSKGNKDLEGLMLAEIRGAMHNDIKAVAGLREPTAFLHRIKSKKGYVMQIDGGKKKQTKEGFYQDKVVGRRQDLVGRSTLTLNPNLGGDQIGIPKDMATKIFQPFIMSELVGLGYSALEAQKHIKDETPIFKKARQIVADKRLVIANRAPSLHRWNMTAMRPTLIDGKSIEVPATGIARSQGGDFDGDSCLQSTIILANKDKFKQLCKSGKTLSFGEYCINTNSDTNYITLIDNFFNERKVVVPGILNVPICKNGELIHVHLEDFPRISETKKVRDNGNEDYDVPDGISIFTINNNTHEFESVAVTKFSIHKNLGNYIVSTSDRNTILLSSDESMVAINTHDWSICKYNPNIIKSSRLMVPKMVKIDIKPSVFKIETLEGSERDVKNHLRCIDTIDLTREFGHYIGMLIGDGWADFNGRVNIVTTYPEIRDLFKMITDKLSIDKSDMHTYENNHDFNGFDSHSEEHCILNHSLAMNVSRWIGNGAKNKHLPSFFINAPQEFRLGLFEGMIDTDSSSTITSHKGRDRYQMLYSTSSPRLCGEFITLSRSLGISASYSYNSETYQISISTTTIIDKNISLKNITKAENLKSFIASRPDSVSSVEPRLDLVPFSEKLSIDIRKIINKTEYNAVGDSRKNNYSYISRAAAIKIISLDTNNTLDSRWVEIVNNTNITWVYVKDIKLNENIDMYDITAPGPYTFMLDNGIIVQDTFQIHTPVSKKALAEAESMLPSSDMLKTGYGTVMNAPGQDAVVGAWLASKGKGGSNKGKFTLDSARKAFDKNEITYADKVDINGKLAPFAMHEINSTIPENVRKYKELTANNIDDWIKETTKKHNGKISLGLADKIKEVGNNYSTKYGFTFGVSDSLSAKEIRDPEIKKAFAKTTINKPLEFITEFSNAKDKIEKKLEKKYNEDTMVGAAFHSGGGKGIGNTSQILSAPVVLADANENPILIPVTKSYSEGLDTSSYWAAAHGARGGNIKKSIQSFKPGWMTTDLINSIYTTKIGEDVPTDDKGVEVKVSDTKNMMNRYLAQPVKTNGGKTIAKRNELINSDTINKLVKSNIKKAFVQSALTDPNPGDAISNYSYGVDYKGNRNAKGTNIGVISAHSVTEPSLNLAMKSFHTGGAFTKSVNAFDMLDRTLRLNKNIPNKAILSPATGVVKDVKKSSIGGYNIKIGDDNAYVANELVVKKGDKVFKGDRLSKGDISAHDILEYKGMKATQNFLVDELDRINSHKLDRRDIEVLVRGLTNTTRVMDPGNNINYIPGDVAPLTTVEWMNDHRIKEVDTPDSVGATLNKSYGRFKTGSKIDNDLMKKLSNDGYNRIEIKNQKIKHEPFLSAGGIASKAAASEDWIARMSHNRVKDVMREGATQGWVSDVSGAIHPLPQLVTGG